MNALTRDFVNLVNTAEENQTAKEQTSGTQFREKLHLMPPVGWLNDPNGLCQMDGVFHAFFQYSPFNAEGGVKMWGSLHQHQSDRLGIQRCIPLPGSAI